MKKSLHNLSKSPIVAAIPAACSDELSAVEFFEEQRWGSNPCCVKCGSVEVYKMSDAKTRERNARFLWRCRDCKEQYTVRIGTVYEESRLPLKHWAYAFWRASTSKKGVSALEIKRHCQISYKSALFLMNRIRYAMAPDLPTAPPLNGIIEVDETYVGGKPRIKGVSKRGRGTSKTPVFVAVERGGQLRRHVVADVTGKTLKEAIRRVVDPRARIMSDENSAYNGIGKEFAGGHETVTHSAKEYARGDVNTNTAESSFALVKRGIIGVYHNVSREYLHRYLWQFDFVWNSRKLNDGERTILAVKSAEGKRMMYKATA
ncbi:MAG TPA: IS1595 family transposase [Terracidiphilus sp.]|jgi:transposase-like protein|nr:IS1595 family transposase [Terracidiphilus sp.]